MILNVLFLCHVDWRFAALFLSSPFIAATASSAVSNGPKDLPALKSSKLAAISRSITDFGVKVIFPRSTLASRRSPT
jgi:hypothetical protein